MPTTCAFRLRCMTAYHVARVAERDALLLKWALTLVCTNRTSNKVITSLRCFLILAARRFGSNSLLKRNIANIHHHGLDGGDFVQQKVCLTDIHFSSCSQIALLAASSLAILGSILDVHVYLSELDQPTLETKHSRPLQAHGTDFLSDSPNICTCSPDENRTSSDEIESMTKESD